MGADPSRARISPWRKELPEPNGRAIGLDLLEVFAEGLDHPEGIAISPDQTIYVGGEEGQVYAVDATGDPRVIANLRDHPAGAGVTGFVLGIAADAADRLYVCDEGSAKLFRVDPADGAVQVASAGLEGRPMRCPNWPAFDAEGNLYVSDSGGWGTGDGLIWVLRPGGRTEVWCEEAHDFPNGLALTPDGGTLFCVESVPGRIVEIPIHEDGSPGPRRVLCELGPAVVPDGVAIADDGALIVACYRPDVIYRWHPDDGLDVLAADPQGTVLAAPTNVAFQGAERDLLVVPNLAGRHLVRGRLGVRGVRLSRPAAERVDG
jgi:gluconolactonase